MKRIGLWQVDVVPGRVVTPVMIVLSLLLAGCATVPAATGRSDAASDWSAYFNATPGPRGYQSRTNLSPPAAEIVPFTGAAHREALTDPNIAEGIKSAMHHQGLAADAAFRRAGNPVSEYMLGMFYSTHYGLPPDVIEAAEQLHKSAAAGYAPAQAVLGDRYEHGVGVAPNRDTAIRWYRLAAAQGEDTASGRLALAMLEGDGIPRDEAGALKILNNCATRPHGADIYNPSGDAGGPACQTLLGYIYQEGKAGVARDDTTALHWLRLAGDQHMPVAEKELARIYAEGRGVVASAGEAALWRERATADADKGPGYWTVW